MPRKFYVDQDLVAGINEQGQGKRSDYVNEALRRVVSPPFRFTKPATAEEASVHPLLEDAREIILVGVRLINTLRTCIKLLERKVAEKVPMTLIIMHLSSLTAGSALFEVLTRQMGNRWAVEGLRGDLDRSVTALRLLRRLGAEHGCQIAQKV